MVISHDWPLLFYFFAEYLLNMAKYMNIYA